MRAFVAEDVEVVVKNDAGHVSEQEEGDEADAGDGTEETLKIQRVQLVKYICTIEIYIKILSFTIN